MPRAHPPHCPGNPSAFGPLPVGHETTSSPNRRLVPLEASAPEYGPSMPPPSPLETSRGTVVLGMEEARTPAGNFDSDRWNATLDRLEAKWAREGTLEYVRSETHTTKVPDALLAILRR